MTTLEQTLLDTLKYPQHCGGEQVVFEAWERGMERWNADQLASCLEKIDHIEYDRRVGAMLDMLNQQPGSKKLKSRFDSVLGRMAAAAESEHPPVPMLESYPYKNYNQRWHVLVP